MVMRFMSGEIPASLMCSRNMEICKDYIRAKQPFCIDSISQTQHYIPMHEPPASTFKSC